MVNYIIIMKYIYYVFSIIIIVVLIVIIFGFNEKQLNAINQTTTSSFTSIKCIDNKPCIVTTCINNQPCHEKIANSTTGNISIYNNKNNSIIKKDLLFPHISV